MARLFSILALAASLSLVAIGCRNATEPIQDESLLASMDAAEVIASTMGSDNGGLHEQLTDVVELTFDGSIIPLAFFDDAQFLHHNPMLSRNGVVRRREYNPATQTWTITVQRSFNTPAIQGSWTRQYRLRFSRNGVGQQFFRTNNQVADLVTFEIVPDSCTGSFKSPRISHRLTRLEGAVRGTISLADTANPIMAIDSLTIGDAKRISNHTVTATLSNVVVPLNRARRFQNIYARATSGTISGTYTANITFINGETYEERQVTREFNIDLSQERAGRLPLSLRGRRGEFRGFFEWVPGFFLR